MKSWLLILGCAVALQISTTKPAFEVATVKRNVAVEGRTRMADQPGGRFMAVHVTLRSLMGFAGWGNQMVNAPTWMESDLWDVEARAAEGSVPPRSRVLDLNQPSPLAPMVQSLLEDQFKLKFHFETRELPVYELTVGKGGPKAKLSDDQSPPMLPEPGSPPSPEDKMTRGMMRMGRGDFEVSGLSMGDFGKSLSALYLGRKVIDKTGLTGLYDFKLQWTPEAISAGGRIGSDTPILTADAVDPTAVSIFSAIQEQLGLKLEASRGPVEVIVIDHVERPSAN